MGKSLNKTLKTQGVFQRQGDQVYRPVPHIATNMPSVDREVLGCGGIPRGRIIEIYGPEAAGKTAFCLHVIAECQKAGGVAAFVDAEHALSPTFAHTLGVDMNELLVSQPDYGEQALEVIGALVESRAVDLVVVDSVTALVPKAELDGDFGDSHMGLHARLMSQAMRKLCGLCSTTGIPIIWINQIREKVGLVFGSPEVTTGGRALKFYSSVRLEVRRIAGSKGGTLKDGEMIYGHKMNVKAVKNKCAAPFKECVVELHYETGFQCAEDLIEHAIKIGILTGTVKFVINGTGSKYQRDELPLDTIKAAVDKYYNDKAAALIATMEESNEEDQEVEANNEG